jgi:hypothetical protein
VRLVVREVVRSKPLSLKEGTMYSKTVVVRLWEETPDGDASAEGELQLNEEEYKAGGGPLYKGEVVTREGKRIWVTIN